MAMALAMALALALALGEKESKMSKILEIESCGECRHCIDLGGQVYECGKLHIAVNWKEIHPDCPLPDYTEKEDE